MPNCIQLIDKSTDEAVPFATIDDRWCEKIGVTPDKAAYWYDWYNIVAFGLAMGVDSGKDQN